MHLDLKEQKDQEDEQFFGPAHNKGGSAPNRALDEEMQNEGVNGFNAQPFADAVIAKPVLMDRRPSKR